MAWREALAEADMGESTMESAVAKVKSSMSVVVNVIKVLMMGGGDGDGVATLEVLSAGGGGTKVGTRLALGGGCFEIGFFEADGEEEAGGEWVTRFVGAGFMEMDFLEACFVVRGEESIIVSQPDLTWSFMEEVALAF